MPGLNTRFFAFVRRLVAAKRGFAAVEFALVAPVMISIYFATAELSDGYVANAKLVSVASTAADLTAQDNQICNADMADIQAALLPIMYPYPVTTLKVVISSLVDAGNNKIKVAWSDAYNTQARSVGTFVVIPTGLVTSGGGGSVVMAEVSYDYFSPGGHLLIGAVHMSSLFYLAPRTVAQIARTTTAC
jgi:Flp pilus assembly protein TadG